MTLVLVALLDGIVFAFGIVLLFDGGRWQQPTGFMLVALAFAYLVFSLLAIGTVLADVIREQTRDTP